MSLKRTVKWIDKTGNHWLTLRGQRQVLQVHSVRLQVFEISCWEKRKQRCPSQVQRTLRYSLILFQLPWGMRENCSDCSKPSMSIKSFWIYWVRQIKWEWTKSSGYWPESSSVSTGVSITLPSSEKLESSVEIPSWWAKKEQHAGSWLSSQT